MKMQLKHEKISICPNEALYFENLYPIQSIQFVPVMLPPHGAYKMLFTGVLIFLLES